MKSPTKPRSGRSAGPATDRLSPRQLNLIVVAALSFAGIAGLAATWSTLFPVPAENLVEVAWTHECQCADGWMDTLRDNGFVVQDYELENLNARRQLWHVPSAVHGCHPAVYMGYIVDGHAPPALLRRLSREHPPAIALIQINQESSANGGAPTEAQFELLYRDGRHQVWPGLPRSRPDSTAPAPTEPAVRLAIARITTPLPIRFEDL